MGDYENLRQMEIGERRWTAPPEEKPPLPLSPSDTTRLAESELSYIAQTLHDYFGYSSDWTETDTAIEIRAILEEMLEMLPAGTRPAEQKVDRLRNVLSRTEPWKDPEKRKGEDATMWFIMRTIRLLAEAVEEIEKKLGGK